MFAWQYRILLLVTSILVTVAIQANFERLEQPSGKEYVDYDLRVRKFNRTAVTLNGTISINQIMDNTMIFDSDVFLSRLGNQQFLHSPLHLPSTGLCELVNHVRKEYPLILEDIENFPQSGECPISVRTMYVKDKMFPTEILPTPISAGLWKMIFSSKVNEKVIFELIAIIRISDSF
uniref:Uncharacterized protein n=1 Tax=Anopheles gambiae TaxID=7165 RepID=A0A1S4HE97_ANOGA